MSSAASAAEQAGTRERILDAGAYLINRNGYAGTRMSEIAGMVGIQASAIYHHFPSRDALVQEIVLTGIRRTMQSVTETLQAMPPGSTAIDRICAAVAAHMEMVLQNSEYASAAIRTGGQLPEGIKQPLLELERSYGAVWRTLFDDGALRGELRDSLEPRAARMLVIGALNYTPEWVHLERGSLRALIDQTQAFVRHSLSAR